MVKKENTMSRFFFLQAPALFKDPGPHGLDEIPIHASFTGQPIDNTRFPLGARNIGFEPGGFLGQFQADGQQVVDMVVHVVDLLAENREHNIAGWRDERMRMEASKGKEESQKKGAVHIA